MSQRAGTLSGVVVIWARFMRGTVARGRGSARGVFSARRPGLVLPAGGCRPPGPGPHGLLGSPHECRRTAHPAARRRGPRGLPTPARAGRVHAPHAQPQERSDRRRLARHRRRALRRPQGADPRQGHHRDLGGLGGPAPLELLAARGPCVRGGGRPGLAAVGHQRARPAGVRRTARRRRGVVAGGRTRRRARHGMAGRAARPARRAAGRGPRQGAGGRRGPRPALAQPPLPAGLHLGPDGGPGAARRRHGMATAPRTRPLPRRAARADGAAAPRTRVVPADHGVAAPGLQPPRPVARQPRLAPRRKRPAGLGVRR